jgi:hypothetical protein
LGVYIEGVLPFTSPTSVPVAPPVNFPSGDSVLPPSIGFPLTVQSGGLISLPLIEPINVRGLTLEQARQKIRDVYQREGLLRNKDMLPILTLIKERTYNISVIRENSGTAVGQADDSARGSKLKLPAYQNDVLHALVQTGGLPGFNERNEVTIFKTSRIPVERRAEVMLSMANMGLSSDNCATNCKPANFGIAGFDNLIESDWVVTIPLRVPPGQIPTIKQEDVELLEGDIVYVRSRETEFYYTGGLLRGGQFPIPRDYDLDVLGAIALAGSGIGGGGQAGGGGGGGGGGIGGGMMGGLTAPPSQLFIIRKLACGRTFNIAVDLQLATNEFTENILVQPGDTLILRHKPHEEILNFGMGTFFTFGIARLFQQQN